MAELKTIVLKVESTHIANGEIQNPRACAVALALNDAGINHSGVKGKTVHYKSTPASRTIRIASLHSKKLANYIKRLDNGELVSPETFLIAVPNWA